MEKVEDASANPQSSQNTAGKYPIATNKEVDGDEQCFIPPDGGLEAWSQVLGGFLLLFNGWGFANSFGVFQTTYQSNSLQSASAISWIGSMQAFLLLVVGVFTGSMFDRGYSRHLIAVGTFLMVLGTFTTSLASQYYQVLLAQGICTGLGAGLLLVPSLATVSKYFEKRRALATGIAACGGSIGGTVYPILFRSLLQKIGFAWTVRVMGFIVLGTLIPCLLITRKGRVDGTVQNREEVDKIDPRGSSNRGPLRYLRTVWQPLPYGIFVLALFFVYCGMYIPTFYLENYAAAIEKSSSSHHKNPASSYLISVLNLSSVAGRVLGSLLADRYGALNIIAPSALACGVLAGGWVGIKSLPALFCFTVLYGYFSGTVASLPPSVIVDLTCKRSPLGRQMDDIGTRMGVAFSIGAVGLLIGNPIAGALVKENTNDRIDRLGREAYVNAQIFCAVTVTLSCILMVVAKWTPQNSRTR